jgi:hypothetical protein
VSQNAAIALALVVVIAIWVGEWVAPRALLYRNRSLFWGTFYGVPVAVWGVASDHLEVLAGAVLLFIAPWLVVRTFDQAWRDWRSGR